MELILGGVSTEIFCVEEVEAMVGGGNIVSEIPIEIKNKVIFSYLFIINRPRL